MPETRAVTPIRVMFLDLPGVDEAQRQGMAIAYDAEVYGLMDATPLDGAGRAQALHTVAQGGVIVGPQYAKLAGLHVGDRVRLQGPGGTRDARVAGVLHAVSGNGGLEMQMSLDTMREVYGVNSDAQLAVRARSDQDSTALERRIRALVADEYPGLELASMADVKRQQQDQVSATFNMFNAIVAIAVIVSLLGVVNTLAMSVLERTREIGVLRALGSSRWQVRRTMLDESLLITSAGAITGVVIGLLIGLSWMRGFGELMPGLTFHFPGATAFAVALAAIVLGTLAAILPARRAARLKVIEALAYE
jgi:putative ABC transport system permease protein